MERVGNSISLQLGSPLPRAPGTRRVRPTALGPRLWGLAARKCCYQPFFIFPGLGAKNNVAPENTSISIDWEDYPYVYLLVLVLVLGVVACGLRLAVHGFQNS